MDTENKYGTLDIQKKLLLLLKDFDSFCQKESISYSLDSGSLLGAIRHKGFIPWDDDLDIIIDRKNYFLLIEKIKNEDNLILERNTVKSLWIDRIRRAHTTNVGKYVPTIDVFIFDNVPDNVLIATLKKYIVFMFQGMMKHKLSLRKGSYLMKLCSVVTFIMGRFFSNNQKYKCYQLVSQWGNKKPSKYGSCYNYTFSFMGTLFPSNTCLKLSRKPFENIEVLITEEYDTILKAIYGDYMKLPTESDRTPKHI